MLKKIISVIAAVAFIGYGAISIINAIEFNNSGVETVATVTGMKQNHRNIDQDNKDDPFEQDITYKYTVDGKEYTGQYTKQFKEGQAIVPPETVRIQYLPNRPQISELAGKKNIPATVAIGTGLAALGVLVFYLTFRRKKKVVQ